MNTSWLDCSDFTNGEIMIEKLRFIASILLNILCLITDVCLVVYNFKQQHYLASAILLVLVLLLILLLIYVISNNIKFYINKK